MDKVWDLVTEVKARVPKTILDVEIPEKIKNPPLWLKVPEKNLTLFKNERIDFTWNRRAQLRLHPIFMDCDERLGNSRLVPVLDDIRLKRTLCSRKWDSRAGR